MNTKLIEIWNSLKSSYWFVPTLMTAIGIVLSFLAIGIDNATVKDHTINAVLSWIYIGDSEGARSLLIAISTSMMSVTGILFSITIVVLSLTSQQFGPRMLKNFMRDTGTQISFGIFIATFIYCLLVVGKIKGIEERNFVPYISVTFGIFLAIASVAVLIYFIHHMSSSIQASQIIAGVGRDLEDGIDSIFPEEIDDDEESELTWLRVTPSIPIDFEKESFAVKAYDNGYVLAIDIPGLVQTAKERDQIIRLEYYQGDFVTRGNTLALAWHKEGMDEDTSDFVSDVINEKFILGVQRTYTQDVEFSVNQLVEIAVRSLSPAINDPFSAMMCIDRLGVGLSMLAERQIPSPYLYDEESRLRVIEKAKVSFSDVLGAGFNQIRQHGRTYASVTIKLLETLHVVARYVSRDEDREAVLRHGDMIMRGANGGLHEELDRRDVEKRYKTILEVVGGDRRDLV